MDAELDRLIKNYWLLSKDHREVADLMIESLNSQLEEPFGTAMAGLVKEVKEQVELIDFKCQMAREEIDNDPKFQNLILGRPRKNLPPPTP